MKKRLFIIVIFLTMFLTSCVSDSDVRTYVKKETPFYNYDSNYTVNLNSMNLYYFEGSSIPYMPVDEFVNDLDGFINAKDYTFKYISFIGEYTISTKVNGEEIRAVVDYKKDKIYTQYLQIFQNTKESQTTDYSSYIKQDLANVDYDMKSIVLDFGKYNIDIICKDKKCYFPFSVLNTLFGAQNYANFYFNGDAIYMTYFVGSDLEQTKLDQIKKSSLTNTVSNEELRKANYNDLLFTLDTFYGLKKYKEISSFEEYITPEIKTKLLSSNPTDFEEGYRQLLIGKLNECHTGIISSSYYTGGNKVSSTEGFDPNVSNFAKIKNLSNDLKEKYNAVYSETKYFEVVGDTAYITSPGFVTGTKTEIFNDDGSVKEDAYKYDTFRLFVYSINQIKSNPNIKNIVVDLSRNGGGNGAAMYRCLGFIKQTVKASIRNEIMGLTMTYNISCDTNMDGKYNSDDAYPNYNWYVLTSGVSYSAANIFAAICKNEGCAKIIGQKTGGGMCGVLPVVTTDGTAFQMSGASMMYVTIDKNNKLNYIEGGVEVDKEISYENFYNREYLNTIISNMN